MKISFKIWKLVLAIDIYDTDISDKTVAFKIEISWQ